MRGLAILLLVLLVTVTAWAASEDSPRPLLAIPRFGNAPSIDGKLGDGEWSRASRVPYTLMLSTWKSPARPTVIYACYTDSALCLAFDCRQEKMPAVEADTGGRDGDVFHQDCVEVFIWIEAPVYYHFGVGIRGTTYEAVNTDKGHPDVSWNPDWKAVVTRQANGWTAELEIPFTAFGSSRSAPGTQWRVNFCRENRSDGEFSSWAPVKAGFHEPASFGTLVFGAEIPVVNIRHFLASPNGVIERAGEIANYSSKPAPLRIETHVPLPTRNRSFSLLVSVDPGDAQKFQLVDEIEDEGRLTAVFEVSSGGVPFYRIVRPFDVPPIRTRLRDLSARLKVLGNLAEKLPQGTSARIVGNLETLKTRRAAASKAAQFIPEATPGQLQGMMASLDVLERGIGINEFLVHFQELKVSVTPGAEFLVWPADPWVQLRPYDLPKGIPQSPEVHALAYRGESIYLAANITNLSDSALDLRVIAGALASEKGTVPSDRIELRGVAFVKEDADAETLVGDALPLLDQAGRMMVPAGQTGQVFIRIRTDGLQAGEYSGELSVGRLTGGPAQKVRLSFTVYPLDLPADPKPWICTWGGILNISWAKPNPDAYLQDAVEHGVNVFLISPHSVAPSLDKDGNLTKPIDYRSHDKTIEAYRPYGMVAGIYSIGLLYDEWAKKAGLEYMGLAYRKGFITWLRDWIGHLKSLGLDYDDFAFEVVDEPGSEAKFKVHMDIGRLVREADPKARILVTANSSNLDYLKQLAEVVDIWVPHSRVLEDELCRKLIQDTGKEMWVYVCAGDSKRLDPVGYYRSLAWQSFARNLTGWGYFAHMWWGEIPWESDSTTKEHLATFSTVYPGTDGPVPSRRWEAYRKGHEDFRALHLLRKLISEAEKDGKDVTAARSVLAEAENAWTDLKAMSEKDAPTAERSAYLDEVRRKVAVASMKL